MSDQLERDFLASPGEHKDEDCWCGHRRMAHHFDPVRDYRELVCADCKREKPAPSFAHFAFDLMDEDDERP